MYRNHQQLRLKHVPPQHTQDLLIPESRGNEGVQICLYTPAITITLRGISTFRKQEMMFYNKNILCYRSTCTLAADLPGIPAICFRIIFVCGDELNLSLSEICKCFLMNTLNIQLEAEKDHFKNKLNNEKPNHPK